MRELKRNRGTEVGYQPAYAEQRAKSRRWRGSRLLRKPDLEDEVLKELGQGWSPEEVAGRLEEGTKAYGDQPRERSIGLSTRRSAARRTTTGGTILPRGKSKRGWRGHKGGRLVDHMQDRVAIDRRAAYIHKRCQAGHWEGELMLFAKYGQAVLVTHERRSRLLVVSRQPNKAADSVATKLTELFSALPKTLRRTITFDNGTEYAYHYRLHELSMGTFFCDPHARWQKGGIENAIGRMRRGLPRKTDLAILSDHRLLSLVRSYNHTPRKCLNYQTPAEVFCRDLAGIRRHDELPLCRTDNRVRLWLFDIRRLPCRSRAQNFSIYSRCWRPLPSATAEISVRS